jgi:hypothetical protein
MARKKKRRVAIPKGTKRVPSVKVETFKQKMKRLRKAGYTEIFKPEGAKKKTKRGLRERAKIAAIKLIARRDGITIAKAKKQYKKALVEIIWAQPTRSAHQDFLEISPGQWREVEKGKEAKDQYTFGPIRRAPYVQRIQSLRHYWATIHLLAETWDISTTEARRYHSKVIKQFGKRDGLEYIYTDLGLYEEQFKQGRSP